ncbi:MAG TPA: DUF1587 domain-containing protein, partial [Planctomycetota bacterium]|nr:DUF1587 domain-containing protein [Planctomycetota bacterium]
MSPGFRLLPFILQVPCAALLAGDGVTDAPAGVAGSGGTTFEGRVVPFLATYCTGCHGGEKKTADLALDKYRDEPSVTLDREVWEKVHKMLLRHEMPPSKRPQPSEVERSAVVGWIQSTLSKIDCTGQVDPGRVTIHRLNRAEYRNTVRDLVGIDYAPAGEFPADEVGYGFDNMGDVLSISPLLVERYVDAADAI